MDQVRKAALDLLCRCEAAGQYSNLALDAVLRRGNFSSADARLLTALVYGVMERKVTLDDWISRLCVRGDGDLAPGIRMILRLGLYQLAFLDKVPDHAAVNETVSLAPKRLSGFVNAILRSFLRQGKTLPPPDAAEDPIRHLSVKYSFSEPVAEMFIREFGLARAERIFAAMNEPAPIPLRVNTQKISRDDYLARLTDAGYDAFPMRESGCGILLRSGAVSSLPGYREGFFFVQDEASQLCVEALDPAPGTSLADLCTCPGSKAFGAAIRMNNTGKILASDLHENKLSLVREGAARLGLSILETRAADARTLTPEDVGRFDRVLCDVPCSGYGVMAKKPELRCKDPSVSEGLPEIQSAILSAASRLVSPGGKLVYSTCTLVSAENGDNVRRFLSGHPEFTLTKERTLAPDTDGTDGFYFAVLARDLSDA